MRSKGFIAAAAFLICIGSGAAQPWKPFLKPQQATDWSQSGVGGIPARTDLCATVPGGATAEQIETALHTCPAEHTVQLSGGTYVIDRVLHVPSGVTLRGAGADKTILDAKGSGEAVILMGAGSVAMLPRVITGGQNAGSTQIVLASSKGVSPGKYLVIAETNDPEYVTAAGSGGLCKWCDGGWSKDGSFARGQVVQVTAVDGNRVSIAPGLYGGYSHAPFAVPFDMAAERAGVEDLQVRANRTGYEANFAMRLCARCWLRGAESNYADGDHVSVQWGYRDEIRDSYFSNAYLHEPGAHDSDIQLALKTSATVVENNIIERTHTSVMLEWGAAGNVIAYNFMMGEFDDGAPGVVIGGVDFHGAHPQYTLIEGNVLTAVYADSVWGSSAQTTLFRNWVVGTNRICTPLKGRGVVDCTGSHYGWQAARAVQWSYLATRNAMVGNVVGSAEMQALKMPNGKPEPQIASLEFPAKRPYEAAVGWTFGYGSANDDGSGTGCGGGNPPCHTAGNAATQLLHGNYNNISKTVQWAPGVPKAMPASFYLASRPEWWGGLPFPAIGVDVAGGGGPGGRSFGNPAHTCYTIVMSGENGGAGSPLPFNASRCYAKQAARKSQTAGRAGGKL